MNGVVLIFDWNYTHSWLALVHDLASKNSTTTALAPLEQERHSLDFR